MAEAPFVTWDETDEEQLLRESARSYIAKHAPPEAVKQWDEEKHYPVELFAGMAELGWFEIGLPGENDGAVASLLTILAEEIGRASTDLVALFNLNASGVRQVALHGTDEQRARWIPPALAGTHRFSIAVTEPDAGSDAAALATTAKPDGDGYILNGQKAYSEGAGFPNTCIELYARTGEGSRKSDGISTFLLDSQTPGLSFRRMPTLGRHISGAFEIFLEDVQVGPEALLGEAGHGWSILQRRLALERLMVGSGFVGAAAAVLDMTIDYTRERKQFGRSICEFQAVSHPLADLYTRIDAAKCAVRRTAKLYDRGTNCGAESGMAKMLTGELYAEMTATAMQLHGAYGYVRDHTLPMHYSDGIIATVVAGSTQIHRNVIARHLGLGRGA